MLNIVIFESKYLKYNCIFDLRQCLPCYEILYCHFPYSSENEILNCAFCRHCHNYVILFLSMIQ